MDHTALFQIVRETLVNYLAIDSRSIVIGCWKSNHCNSILLYTTTLPPIGPALLIAPSTPVKKPLKTKD